MAKLPKDFRPLHAQLIDAGATMRTTGTGHRKYTLPDGTTLVFASSPSDWRALRHCKAQVRRALLKQQPESGRTA